MFIYWSRLPPEVQENVFLLTPIFDLMRARWACKSMEKMIFDKSFQSKYCAKNGEAPHRLLFRTCITRRHHIYIRGALPGSHTSDNTPWPSTRKDIQSRPMLDADGTARPRDYYKGFHIMTFRDPATARSRSPTPEPKPEPEPAVEDPVRGNANAPPPPPPPGPDQGHRDRSVWPRFPARFHGLAQAWQYFAPAQPVPVVAGRVWHNRALMQPAPVVRGRVPRYRAPVQPIPVQPVPRQPVPVQPIPVQPIPVQPVPRQPVPVQPILVQPVPRQPVPVQPILVQPVPMQPVPVQPISMQPIPVQPIPLRPVPVQPVPRQPVPVHPIPVRPVPVQPVPVQPVPVVEERMRRKRKDPSMSESVTGPVRRGGSHPLSVCKPPCYRTQPDLYNVFYQRIFKSETPIQIINLSDSDDE